jgi:hypothetical protein
MNDDSIKLFKSLIYVSTAKYSMGHEKVMDILQVSWRHNHNSDISGILIYDDNYFVQLLQGPINTVDTLYEKISNDIRHHSIELIGTELLARKDVNGWGMGLINNQEIVENLYLKHNIKHAKGLYESEYSSLKSLLIELKHIL